MFVKEILRDGLCAPRLKMCAYQNHPISLISRSHSEVFNSCMRWEEDGVCSLYIVPILYPTLAAL